MGDRQKMCFPFIMSIDRDDRLTNEMTSVSVRLKLLKAMIWDPVRGCRRERLCMCVFSDSLFPCWPADPKEEDVILSVCGVSLC